VTWRDFIGSTIRETIETFKQWRYKRKFGQAYFWTPEWQAGEREATDDIRHGRTMRFSNAKTAITYLRSTNKISYNSSARSDLK
jgi:hypothetical protein